MEYIAYVKTDSNGYITAVNSSAFLSDTAGWTEIDSGYGDKSPHAQGNYLDKPLFEEHGVPVYKFVDGEVVERTEAEIAADIVEPTYEPTDIEILNSKVDFLAMVSGIDFEEV